MKLEALIEKGDATSQLVRAALNILLESPYFYKTDDERAFLTVMRYRQAFAAFFEKMFGWTLVMDAKCIRLYKPKWYNEAITQANRDLFGFTRRDACIGFLLLLEFFEREAREQGVTTEDRENLKFLFGDWLEYSALRFRQLFPDKTDAYTDEKVRQTLLISNGDWTVFFTRPLALLFIVLTVVVTYLYIAKIKKAASRVVE